MAPSVGSLTDAGLEGLCQTSDRVQSQTPGVGVELLRARLSGRAYASHRHQTYGICLTELGVQRFDYRGQTETSLPGQLVVLHPDELHDGRAGDEHAFGYGIVYVEPALIGDAIHAVSGAAGALPFVRQPVLDQPRLARTVARAFWDADEPLAVDDLVVCLAEGLLEASGDRPTPPAHLDRPALGRVRDLLWSQPTGIRSAELERVTGLSRYELARQFRCLYGTSPARYARGRRLEQARSQLAAGARLADLAQAGGFADQAHLTRLFKSAFGVTPGRYRRWQAAQRTAPRERRQR